MLDYNILFIVLAVFILGIVAGVALDHWAKRKGNLISGTVSRVESLGGSVVSEATHVLAITSIIRALVPQATLLAAAAPAPVAVPAAAPVAAPVAVPVAPVAVPAAAPAV